MSESGAVLRDRGAASVDSREDGVWWRSCVDTAIDTLCASGQRWTTDDLRDLGVPEPLHPNAWGARLIAAARRGQIVRVGYVPSRRAESRGRALAQWRGVV